MLLLSEVLTRILKTASLNNSMKDYMPDLITERAQRISIIKRRIFLFLLNTYFSTASSDSTVSDDAGIEPMQDFCNFGVDKHRFNRSARYHPHFIFVWLLARLECVGHSFAYVAHLYF
jgi:hypothetical protein